MLALKDDDVEALRREAGHAAIRLSRTLRLSFHEREDVMQDLLADLWARLKHFDPQRGSLGAFAATVMKRRATRLAHRHVQHRAVFCRSLNEPLDGSDQLCLSDLVPEDEGYGALMGQQTAAWPDSERRMDLHQALSRLSSKQQSICWWLTELSPSAIANTGLVSRAGLYRELTRIKLELAVSGIAEVG